MHFWRLSMIKWSKLLYILRMASDHILDCSWGHNWLIWMKFSENVHRTFQFLGRTSIELKKNTKFAKCIYWFKLIHTWLWSKNLELKIHIGFIHHCEVYTEKSMEKTFVLFLITSHLVGSFGEGKLILYRICNIQGSFI